MGDASDENDGRGGNTRFSDKVRPERITYHDMHQKLKAMLDEVFPRVVGKGQATMSIREAVEHYFLFACAQQGGTLDKDLMPSLLQRVALGVQNVTEGTPENTDLAPRFMHKAEVFLQAVNTYAARVVANNAKAAGRGNGVV